MMELSVVYPELVRRAWERGVKRTARGKTHRALFNVVLETWATENLLVGLPKKFAIAELMAYVSGWDDVSWLARFNKNIGQFSDDGVIFAGAYGPRIELSVPKMIDMLVEDPESRQAYCAIFEPDDLTRQTKDKPCNTAFQLQVWSSQLHMTVYQRSCDLVWGLPFDHFSFSTILILLANQLGLQPGSVTRLIANAHVYEPEAGYADMSRVEKAMTMNETTWWKPNPDSYLAFRNAAQEARFEIERPGENPDLSSEARYLIEVLK